MGNRVTRGPTTVETLTILHTNDLHSHFENWPKIRRFIQARQAAEQAAGHSVLTFDDGDAMDRVHPLTDATAGRANVKLMAAVHYDAVTIGNNEGIGNSHDELLRLYDEATFPVLVANLFEPDGRRPAFAKPWLIKTTPAGTRVAIVGFTAPYFLTYTPNGWRVKPVAEVFPELLATAGGTYDVLVVLSHLGLPADRYLASHYPAIDVIVGGHTHHLLPQGELAGRTLLTAAGKWGQHVGEITLTLDDHHRVVEKRAKTIATTSLPSVPADDAEIAGYEAKGNALLAQRPVARLPHGYAIAYEQNSPLLQLGLAALAEQGGTRAALLNAGLFLGDLPAGVITQKDLHQLLPHPMHLMRITLNGLELWRLVMEIEKNRRFLRRFQLVGMSFRGKIFGEMGLLGLAATPARTVTYFGEPLVPERQYTITGLDHYLFIPFFPTIEIMGDNQLLFPDQLRTAFGRYLATRFPL